MGGRQATFTKGQDAELTAFLESALKRRQHVEFTADFDKLRQYRSAAAYSGTVDFTGKKGGIDPFYLLNATETRTDTIGRKRARTVRTDAWEGVTLFVRNRPDIKAASGLQSVTVTVIS